MPILHFTKRAIEALPHPETGQIFYRDALLTGFGLRVGAKSKVYFVESQVQHRTVRTSIGRADIFPPEVARKKALSLLAEMAEGVHPNRAKRLELAEKISLGHAFDIFFAAKRCLAFRTVDGYTRTRDMYLLGWKRLPLQDITRQMVVTRHQQITRRYGAVTANNVMRHLRSVYNFTAAAHNSFPPNPVTVLSQSRIWHREQRRRGIVAAHQLPAWWRAVMVETPDARDVMLTALLTGMRRTEILTMKWEYLDFAGKLLRLPRTKNGDPFELPMSEFLYGLLKQRQSLVGQSEWVFPGNGKTGHIVETKSFTRRVVAAAGITFSLHDLRRTYITIAESIDIQAYALKRLMNHRAAADVTGGYIVIGAERLRRPVQQITETILRLADVNENRKVHTGA
jgi:integrase